MVALRTQSPHTFHIPVMGTGFTIDTPLKVARYGISSVISLVDDHLIEQMRKFHAEKAGEPYDPIGANHEDRRARRITAYLNLLDRLVTRQVAALRASPFEAGSEITRYFELLPENALKAAYLDMLATDHPAEKERKQRALRERAVPGSIDVNIMSKSDCDIYVRGEKLPPEFSTAMAALRGFANSTPRSAIIFSAGMNPRLYNYLPKFEDFYPDPDGVLKKEIVLKVSDYRSAWIQGKFLAKKGLWVSEYRIESGLNCGGHVFPSGGALLGPIMEEFRKHRAELPESLLPFYYKGLDSRGVTLPKEEPGIRVTVQGGIGTAFENQLLHRYYEVDGTGWATPFMLVPEVTNLDEAHLEKLIGASSDEDVFLSDSSPFGAPFWNLRRSASEQAREQRIRDNRPGSLCPKGFVRFSTEFTKVPICGASHAYQKRKLEDIEGAELTQEQYEAKKSSVLAKSCICDDLAGGALVKNGIDTSANPAICCGPNIVNYSKIATLEEMVGHIYGKLSLLTNPERPHMFVREISIYVEYLLDEMRQLKLELSSKPPKYFQEFKETLLNGIEYYRSRAGHLVEERQDRFLSQLKALRERIEEIPSVVANVPEPQLAART